MTSDGIVLTPIQRLAQEPDAERRLKSAGAALGGPGAAEADVADRATSAAATEVTAAMRAIQRMVAQACPSCAGFQPLRRAAARLACSA